MFNYVIEKDKITDIVSCCNGDDAARFFIPHFNNNRNS